MSDALLEQALALPGGRRQIIALAGPPASGKSTLAETLARDLTAAGRQAAVVPMDGFHLDNRVLDARGLRHRKGAPDTFDLRGFARLMADLATGGEVIYPLFDRDRDLAIAGAGVLPEPCDLVVVEGITCCLMRQVGVTCPAFWTFSVFLDVPRARLLERLTARWIAHGLSAEDALARADGNDLANAELVQGQRLRADMILGS